jgi:hypothetical protein
VELFFKWIKTYQAFLRDITECGKDQIWIVASVYVLAAIIKKELALEISLYTFLQILSVRPSRKSRFQAPFSTLRTILRCLYHLIN